MAKILTVDDEKDVLTLMKFILEREGHEIMEAHDGAEALSIMGIEPPAPEKKLPDLIILDIMMPVMDGYTLNSRLQQSDLTSRIPVLVLTAKGQMRDLFELAPNVGAYLEKPFEPKHLTEMVKKLLKK